MFDLIEVTESIQEQCNPSYDDPITCDPDSGWCNPDLCNPAMGSPSSNCGPDYGDCNPD